MVNIKVKTNQMEEVEGLYNDYPYVHHHALLGRAAVPWHWHEALEFDLVVSGTVTVSTTGQTCEFHPGEGFFVNSNVLAQMSGTPDAVMESHLFEPVFLGGHFHSVFETKYLNPVLQDRKIELVCFRGHTPWQRTILQKLRQLTALQQEPDSEFQTRNTLSEIWLQLLGELREGEAVNRPGVTRNQERLLTMLAFIQTHYDEQLTLEDIAAAASVSKRECLRSFRAGIHRTPMEYLTDYRIDMAKKLLRTTDLPITQIALQTGWCSAAYFSKIFRESCGTTPFAYRKEAAPQ